MTQHILVVLAIASVPWTIGLGTLLVARTLGDRSTLAITDDSGQTHRVEAIS